MSTSFLSATLDLRDVEKGLRALARAGKNLAPAFRELAPVMRRDQREHASAKSGPESKWAPRTKATMAEYAKRGKKRAPRILGRLVTAVKYAATSSSLSATSTIPGKISATHQDGGTGNHGAKIPARPFLWLSMNFLSTAEDVMSRRMLDAFGGG